MCGDCGGVYRSKVWHSTSKYRCVIWQCNAKFKNGKKCATPHFYEDELKALFVDAFNSLLADRESIFAAYEEIIADLTDNTALPKEATVDCLIVRSDTEFTFRFKDGTELPWNSKKR
ncbi:zinc ribbon domain-containing protein [Caproiciproducens faecalis]|uniref:zinc ribbon domain-containing protein n=1 Tax=Caproiciproducens faecalis TaxID=2820301 RepID=UPI002ED400FD